MCNLNDQYIFILGSGTGERFDIVRRQWATLPFDMQVYRQAAGSCAISGTVYAFFGQNDRHEPVSSIERLRNADRPVSQMTTRFQLLAYDCMNIQPDASILARWFPAVAAINDT